MDPLVSVLTCELGMVEMQPPALMPGKRLAHSACGCSSGGNHEAHTEQPPPHLSLESSFFFAGSVLSDCDWLLCETNERLWASMEVLTLFLLLPVPVLGWDPASSQFRHCGLGPAKLGQIPKVQPHPPCVGPF